MKELEKHLRAAVDDKHIIGLEYGDTIGADDAKAIEKAVSQGIKIKGHYADDVKVTVTLHDVWRYYVGDELVEDETGCAHIQAEYGGETEYIILQWLDVNGKATPVDTDGDGK